MERRELEYPDHFLDRLEIIWGKGFLSPGGATEVMKVVDGIDLRGKAILDIGCGTGGPTIVLVRDLGAAKVVALDIEAGVLARAKANAATADLADRIDFRLVEPGPLPVADGVFDVVFSKDAITQIPDKSALFRDVLRALRPGGVFAASDWLGGENTAVSPEWAHFRDLTHLTFAMSTATEFKAAMRAHGFERVTALDRKAWYAPICADEVNQIAGPLRDQILAVVDEAVYDHWLEVRRALAAAVAAGALRPTHLRGYKAEAFGPMRS